MAKLPDLKRMGLKWGNPPPHVVPDLSMVDKLRILTMTPGEWAMVREGIKQTTAKNVAKQLRDGIHASIGRIHPHPPGMFDAVAGNDPDCTDPEIEGETWCGPMNITSAGSTA